MLEIKTVLFLFPSRNITIKPCGFINKLISRQTCATSLLILSSLLLFPFFAYILQPVNNLKNKVRYYRFYPEYWFNFELFFSTPITGPQRRKTYHRYKFNKKIIYHNKLRSGLSPLASFPT